MIKRYLTAAALALLGREVSATPIEHHDGNNGNPLVKVKCGCAGKTGRVKLDCMTSCWGSWA